MSDELFTRRVSLWYPRSDTQPRQPTRPQAIEIDLIDVRAADTIRVTYDFDRDGYVVGMKLKRERPGWMEEVDGEWREVAFVPSWLEET